MDKKGIKKAIEDAIQRTRKRGFKQSLEIGINFWNINIEDAKNKLNISVYLPKGRGKDVNIGVFADGDMGMRAKKLTKYVLSKNEIMDYSKNKRKMRKYANSCYAFLAQPDLMPVIGKAWGVVLGPRSKMPSPVVPNVFEQIFNKSKNTIKLKSKKLPTVHAPIGVEDMSADDLTENAMEIINNVTRVIPEDKILSVYIKTTMGPSVKVK